MTQDLNWTDTTATAHTWLNTNPWMAAGIWLQIVLAALALTGMVFDKREILGMNAWIKPFKFDISVLVMLMTITAFLSGYNGSALCNYGLALALPCLSL